MLLLALLPLALGYWVNARAPYPASRAHAAGHCTRYCALHYCTHATRANSPAYYQLLPVYDATVRTLASGGRGWYAATNVVVYLVLLPALLVWLTYGALRDGQRLAQLRRHA
ncbi:hypothetical protein GKZ68_18085 [Hymenobacter sp. BRD128]|uniref:hypothetical protein n=1 Tax=Hymenobacter sp. BRD128 TaxID=2675878 RepID=UPI001566D269|nr:hypothetical protein [Hymenobacter sp. BRD128]QKG58370.1 hypothetical protein GKZ68_18085 [Hymenobacter sp. BRD128]